MSLDIEDRKGRAAALIERLTHRPACASCGVVVAKDSTQADFTRPEIIDGRLNSRNVKVPVCADCLADERLVQVQTHPAVRLPHFDAMSGKSTLYTAAEEFTETYVQCSELHRVAAVLGLDALDRAVLIILEGDGDNAATWTTSTVGARRGPSVQGTKTRWEFLDTDALREAYDAARRPFLATHTDYPSGCSYCRCSRLAKPAGWTAVPRPNGRADLVLCSPCLAIHDRLTAIGPEPYGSPFDAALADACQVPSLPGLAASYGIEPTRAQADVEPWAYVDRHRIYAHSQRNNPPADPTINAMRGPG